MKPRVLIPVALGTNRDADLALAFNLAGAEAESVPLTALRSGERALSSYDVLALPGGFSYGDALGAGRLFGLDLASWFGDQLLEARDRGIPMFGVCNGFQALVRAGLLPGDGAAAVLTQNERHQFECRWVTLDACSSRSIWTRDLAEPLRCPVAHGEGRFISDDLAALEANDQVALRYVTANGDPADLNYPTNPNGSPGDVAGVCDPTGMILGLMPHPENHVLDRQNPLRGRDNLGNCLPLFKAGISALVSA